MKTRQAVYLYVKLVYMRLQLFALAACTSIISLSSFGSTQTGSRLAEPDWRARFHEKSNELHTAAPKIIFLGDSILHSFEWLSPDPVWDHWYGGRRAVNLGFNGDGVSNVIWRIDHGEADGIAPKLAVILIGTNDLWLPANTIVGNISLLAAAIRQRTPTTRILILGILPSGKPEAEVRNANAVNAALKARYGDPDAPVSYLDVACVFLHHGQLNTTLFREPAIPGSSEPLHPTLQGMNLLAARIEPIVAATLGDAPRSTPGFPRETDCQAGR